MISKGVALITGSAGGIGRAISMRLARDGFDIALNDLPKNRDALHALQKQIVSQGRRAIVVAANVTQEKEVKDMTGETVDALGELNVVRGLRPLPLLSLSLFLIFGIIINTRHPTNR